MSNKDFRLHLYKWYDVNRRSLPWRETFNPYYIWLSEVIMQQTKIVQGLSYYLEFVKKYPTVFDLAKASQDDVLSTWQGLGYYSRARNLHEASKYIVNHFAGEFPNKYEDIKKLKGVGDYTAAAIASFAFNLPYVAIDGNFYRVLSRIFGLSEPIDTGKGKKVFETLGIELLDLEDPSKFNNAIMDFGALQCTPKQAQCETCPFMEVCVAHKSHLVSKLPVKKNKVKVRDRYFYYFDICQHGSMWLKKRTDNDIWQGLYDLMLIEKDVKVDDVEILDEFGERMNFCTDEACNIEVEKRYETLHILTHQRIHVVIFKINFNGLCIDLSGMEKYFLEDALSMPISTLLKNYLISQG